MTSLKPHSKEWYLRLATLQQGYYYPWKAHLPPLNGEDVYIQMVHDLLTPDKDVLDAGCGHGEFTLSLAGRCRSILAYDRVPAYINLAEKTRLEQGIDTIRFELWDSSADVHGKGTLPAADNSFDLMISRRGPLNWLEDARRAGRPGAVLLQLNPMEVEPPQWMSELPEPLRWGGPGERTMRQAVTYALSLGGLQINACWSFEVPELFDDPYQLYVFLTWGNLPDEVPSYAETQTVLESIFTRYAGSGGLPVRHGRFLWTAVVDK
jgi:23S rRNA (guanine745-N1)-methyltransferase